jgi:hypothetical protein
MNSPVGTPEFIKTLSGIAEALAVTDGGNSVHYHKHDKARFYIYALARR